MTTLHRGRRLALLGAGLFWAALAHGADFKLGDLNGSFNSQISIGSSWRISVN